MIKNTNKRIVITLSSDELKKIDELSRKLGVTKSVVIKLALLKFY